MQSQLLTCAAGCQRVILDALLSPVQSRLPTCAAGWQRVVLDAALSPVQSRLLTCAAGVVDAPVSDRSSSSCNPVLGWGLRNCRLAESCLRRSLSSSYSSSWGGVYVIAGFTDVVNSWRAPTTYDIYMTTPRPSCTTSLARSRSPIM